MSTKSEHISSCACASVCASTHDDDQEQERANVYYNVKISCIKPARAEIPQCECWEHPPQESVATNANTQGKFVPHDHWLKPEHWSLGIFAGAPAPWKKGACMRVCDKTGRLGHLSMANGAIGIDIPLLAADPNDPTAAPVFIQHGYCCVCDRFEWVLYTPEKPQSPIIWLACKKL